MGKQQLVAAVTYLTTQQTRLSESRVLKNDSGLLQLCLIFVVLIEFVIKYIILPKSICLFHSSHFDLQNEKHMCF